MKKTVAWDVTPCCSCWNRSFGGTCHLHHQGGSVVLCSVLQLLVMANVPSAMVLSTLMMKAIRSSETSVLTTTTQRHISEDDSLRNV
jgi:hypothetical protein